MPDARADRAAGVSSPRNPWRAWMLEQRYLRAAHSLPSVTDPGQRGRRFACRKATALKLTIDSSEPLEDAIRVLGALYGVTLLLSSDDQDASKPATEHPSGPAKRLRTARRKSSVTRKARPVASAADADAPQPEQQAAQRSARSPSNAEVRAWARESGLTVSERGRVAASVLTAYRDAHNL